MKRIKINVFDKSSIDNAIREIENYTNQLIICTQNALAELGDLGIQIAYQNSGEYEGHISYTQNIQVENELVRLTVIGKDISPLRVEWKTAEGSDGYDISPLLMAEFGSGWKAQPRGISGVGQGTHPNQKHAFDPKGWFWEDLDGKKHHSYGETPTAPMLNAEISMVKDIELVFRKHFGSING